MGWGVFCKGAVDDYTLSEKGIRPFPGAVDNLVRNDDIERLDVLLKADNSAYRYYPFNPQ